MTFDGSRPRLFPLLLLSAVACGEAGSSPVVGEASSSLDEASRQRIEAVQSAASAHYSSDGIPAGSRYFTHGSSIDACVEITPRGSLLINDAAEQNPLEIALASLNGAAVPSATAVSGTNRVDLTRPGLAEWFRNGPVGLEHGFRVESATSLAQITLGLSVDAPGQTLTLLEDGVLIDLPGMRRVRFSATHAMDAAGTPIAVTVTQTATGLSLELDVTSAVGAVSVQGIWSIDDELRRPVSEVAEGDNFGAAMEIEGDWAVVGAPGENRDAGAIHIFHRVDGVWRREHRKPGDVASRFGEKVSLSGDRVAAWGTSDAREITLLERRHGSWNRLPSFSSSSPIIDFSLRGDLLAVRNEEGVQLHTYDGRALRRTFSQAVPECPLLARAIAFDGRTLAFQSCSTNTECQMRDDNGVCTSYSPVDFDYLWIGRTTTRGTITSTGSFVTAREFVRDGVGIDLHTGIRIDAMLPMGESFIYSSWHLIGTDGLYLGLRELDISNLQNIRRGPNLDVRLGYRNYAAGLTSRGASLTYARELSNDSGLWSFTSFDGTTFERQPDFALSPASWRVLAVDTAAVLEAVVRGRTFDATGQLVHTGRVYAHRLLQADADLDGVPDAEDACPSVAFVPGFDVAPRDGCTDNRDGDHLDDPLDACPTEPVSAGEDLIPSGGNGCPDLCQPGDREYCHWRGVCGGDGRTCSCDAPEHADRCRARS